MQSENERAREAQQRQPAFRWRLPNSVDLDLRDAVFLAGVALVVVGSARLWTWNHALLAGGIILVAIALRRA